jgi:ribosome-associated protein
MTSLELTKAVCTALSEKKGRDIVYLDVTDKTSLCNYFVVASGTSSTQVKALAENVEEKMEKLYDLAPTRLDGVRDGRWAVLDYGDVIVHVFNEEAREFYRLERLWDNGKNMVKFEA